MLNKIIKIDLHIHSDSSEYKEAMDSDTGKSIVSDSNVDNIKVLLNKLKYNDVRLFSITDHNRINVELYIKIFELLKEEEYQDLHVLVGVEFDMKFDENMKVCHIVTIFDVKNETDIYRIHEILEKNKLKNKDDYYSKDKYEEILKLIGLSTLLIVHQKTDLNKKSKKHKSLNESIENPYEVIRIGYIDALEYNKPQIEGILIRNLRDVDESVGLITGSDCHQWSVYPAHHDGGFSISYFSEIKSLPTFKGLLMALTSIETRFNRSQNIERDHIKSFEINDKIIELDPGINVIIGENGSGKSSFLNILANTTYSKKGYIKNIIKENKIIYKDTIVLNRIKFIQQSEIIEKFKNDSLFSDSNEYFNEIDDSNYESAFRNYSESLKNVIDSKIEMKINLQKLTNKNLILDVEKEQNDVYYVQILPFDNIENNNIHSKRRNELATLLIKLKNQYDDLYYNEEEKNIFKDAIQKIYEIYLSVLNKEIRHLNSMKCINHIISEVEQYNTTSEKLSTSLDKGKLEYNKAKSEFISSIVNVCREKINQKQFPNFPEKVMGFSTKPSKGFVFNKEKKYNNKEMNEEFFSFMFVSQYQSEEALKTIDDKPTFINSISGLGSGSDTEKINRKWNENLDKFINETTKSLRYIREDDSTKNIGGTLGEMSLVYYKFNTYNNSEWDIIMIDQPEDNISNSRISQELITYLNNLRDKKQVIIVTHNPLLVVNLDVDNVVFLNKVNNKIDVYSGCLEDEENRILEFIATSMDGGKEMIEKRMRVYG